MDVPTDPKKEEVSHDDEYNGFAEDFGWDEAVASAATAQRFFHVKARRPRVASRLDRLPLVSTNRTRTALIAPFSHPMPRQCLLPNKW